LCGLVTGVISGHLQQQLGYISYFVLVMVATIPSFLACWFAPFHVSDRVADQDEKARLEAEKNSDGKNLAVAHTN